MTRKARFRSSIVAVLVPLSIVATGALGCLLVMYGLNLLTPRVLPPEGVPESNSAGQLSGAIPADPMRPALEVGAAVSPLQVVPGEEVTYSITVSNVGELDLALFIVTDSLEGDLLPAFPLTLAAGASRGRTLPWVIPSDAAGPMNRTLTVYAGAAGEVVSDTVVATVGLLEPSLHLEASVSPTTTVRGGEAIYTVTVGNRGPFDLTAVRVVDSLLGDVSTAFPDALPVDTTHRAVYAWTSPPEAPGTLIRSVTGYAEGAGQVISSTATVGLNLVGVEAAANAPSVAWVGKPVAAMVTVSNTSSVGAPELTLESIHAPGETTVPDACGVLRGDEVCAFAHEIVPAEEGALTTSIEVRYRAPGFAGIVTATAEHTMVVGLPWERGTGLPGGVAVRALAVCPADAEVVYAGFGSGGRGVYRSEDGGETWAATGFEGGDVFGLAVDPGDCDRVCAGAWRDGVRKSEDGGSSWEASSEGLEGAFVYSVVVDPGDEKVLYAGTALRGVYRSEDGGAGWSPWGLEGLTVPHLGVTGDGGVVYAATWGEGVQRRERREASWGTWAVVSEGIAAEHGQVYGVEADPGDDATVYAATASGGLYRTLDGGGVWERVLPSPERVYAVVVDAGEGMVYAGTEAGLYWSAAGGEAGSWQMMVAGPEGQAVQGVAIGAEAAEYVHVGSGDGAWRLVR